MLLRTGGHVVVPGAGDPAGRQALLDARRCVVHWLYLRGDDQSAAPVPRRLGAAPEPERLVNYKDLLVVCRR